MKTYGAATEIWMAIFQKQSELWQEVMWINPYLQHTLRFPKKFENGLVSMMQLIKDAASVVSTELTTCHYSLNTNRGWI